MNLPGTLTRYVGANVFSCQDAAGNVFYVFQGPNNSGRCVLLAGDGVVRELVLPAPIQGRPSVDVNPFVGMWVIGNQEVSARQLPPRYRIAEYVPFGHVSPGSGGPVAAEQAAALAPITGETWPNGGQPYAGDVVSDGKLALRLSKIIRVLLELRASVVQLQRLARQRGELR
jgi:hypothetical protein